MNKFLFIIFSIFTLVHSSIIWTPDELAKYINENYELGVTLLFDDKSYITDEHREKINAIMKRITNQKDVFVYGIFSWSKNSKNSHVTPQKISPQEWTFVGIIMALFGLIFYFVLVLVDCQSLHLNLISMLSLTMANYLLSRRSFGGFAFLITNDIILIMLWGNVIIQGDLSVATFFLCAIIYFINDI